MAPVMNVVDTIDREAGAEQYLASLRLVPGYWRQLQALRQQAVRNPKTAEQYRSYLTRGIDKAIKDQQAMAPIEGAEGERLSTAFGDFAETLRQQKGVAAIEANRRPQPMEDWCQKWLPEAYDAYWQSLTIFINTPSQRAFDGVKNAFASMVDIYVAQCAEGRSRGTT